MSRFLKQKKREDFEFVFNSITAKGRLPVFHSRFSDSSSHKKTKMSIPNPKISQISQVFKILELLLMFRSHIFWRFVVFFGVLFWFFLLNLLKNPKVCHTTSWFWEAELVSSTVLQYTGLVCWVNG